MQIEVNQRYRPLPAVARPAGLRPAAGLWAIAAALILSVGLMVLIAGAVAAARWLPAAGEVALLTAPFRSRPVSVYRVDVSRGFVHHQFDLPWGVSRAAFSPDGLRLAFVLSRADDTRIHVADLTTGAQRNISGVWTLDDFPAWSPDGQRLAYISGRNHIMAGEAAALNLFVIGADGGGLRQITGLDVSRQTPAWSPDGRQLAFSTGATLTVADVASGEVLWQLDGLWGYGNIAYTAGGDALAFTAVEDRDGAAYVVSLADRQPRRLTPNTLDVRLLAWSPGGDRLAFMAFDHLGRAIVYVMDAACTVTPDGAAFVTPGCAGPQPLSSGEGFAWLPAWSRDGERLTFIMFQDRQNQAFVVERSGGSPRRLSSITVGDFEAAWLR